MIDIYIYEAMSIDVVSVVVDAFNNLLLNCKNKLNRDKEIGVIKECLLLNNNEKNYEYLKECIFQAINNVQLEGNDYDANKWEYR